MSYDRTGLHRAGVRSYKNDRMRQQAGYDRTGLGTIVRDYIAQPYDPTRQQAGCDRTRLGTIVSYDRTGLHRAGVRSYKNDRMRQQAGYDRTGLGTIVRDSIAQPYDRTRQQAGCGRTRLGTIVSYDRTGLHRAGVRSYKNDRTRQQAGYDRTGLGTIVQDYIAQPYDRTRQQAGYDRTRSPGAPVVVTIHTISDLVLKRGKGTDRQHAPVVLPLDLVLPEV